MKNSIVIIMLSLTASIVFAQQDTVKTQLHFKDFIDLPIGATFQYSEGKGYAGESYEIIYKYTITDKLIDTSNKSEGYITYTYLTKGYSLSYNVDYRVIPFRYSNEATSTYTPTISYVDSTNHPLNKHVNDWAVITDNDFTIVNNNSYKYLTQIQSTYNDSLITLGGPDNLYNNIDTSDMSFYLLQYQYAKGLGLVSKAISMGEGGCGYSLEGYIIGSTQYGTVYSDSYFTVGINESQFNKNNITIMPTETPNIYKLSNIESVIALAIYNINGQVLFSANSISNNQTVDITNYSSGMYFVKVLNAQGVQVKKIIKE